MVSAEANVFTPGMVAGPEGSGPYRLDMDRGKWDAPPLSEQLLAVWLDFLQAWMADAAMTRCCSRIS